MATTTNITTNFVGEVAGEYIAKMIQEANTISENLILEIYGLLKKWALARTMTTYQRQNLLQF